MSVHANYSFDWGTPPDLCRWIRRSCGGILLLDTCSSKIHNRRMKAQKYYTRNGHKRPWKATSHCNPPGGNSVKIIQMWWSWGIRQLLLGNCRDLYWCFFNSEHARQVFPRPMDIPGYLILPHRRTAFYRPNGKRGTQPRYWSWWFSNREPAPFPRPHHIARTGLKSGNLLISPGPLQ